MTSIVPLAADGTMTLVPGDDYFAVDGRSLDFNTSTSGPSLISATAALAIRLKGAGTPNMLATTGTILGAASLRFEPTAAQTVLLTSGVTADYQVQVMLSGSSHVTTVIEGEATILRNIA